MRSPSVRFTALSLGGTVAWMFYAYEFRTHSGHKYQPVLCKCGYF